MKIDRLEPFNCKACVVIEFIWFLHVYLEILYFVWCIASYQGRLFSKNPTTGRNGLECYKWAFCFFKVCL